MENKLTEDEQKYLEEMKKIVEIAIKSKFPFMAMISLLTDSLSKIIMEGTTHKLITVEDYPEINKIINKKLEENLSEFTLKLES